MVVYSHVIKMLTEQLDVFIASSLHGAEKRQGRRADSLEFRHKM